MCNKEKFWGVLVDLLCKPEWNTDPDFATFAKRLENRERVTQMLDGVLMQRSTADWMALFAGKVPASPVYDIAQALENPYLVEREALADYLYPDGRSARMVAGPIRVAGVSLPHVAAPAMGADTDAMLLDAGYSADQIDVLRQAGVI
jgi:crotonobetainyl-CoA:carnitine CoA-transferase CaiB-like acyl-CoA transferase